MQKTYSNFTWLSLEDKHLIRQLNCYLAMTYDLLLKIKHKMHPALLHPCADLSLSITPLPTRQLDYMLYMPDLKASAHSFKQFISRLLKLSFSLSMHLYNSDGRHAWFHLHGTSRHDRSASEATKYKMKNSLSTVGLEPSTPRFQVWCSTYWASRAWWMLSV